MSAKISKRQRSTMRDTLATAYELGSGQPLCRCGKHDCAKMAPAPSPTVPPAPEPATGHGDEPAADAEVPRG